MKVVILCAGKGTRIRDVTQEIPKPMIPIDEYPIVKHILDIYTLHGYEQFILCLGYLGWNIKEYFFNFRAMSASVELDFTNGGAINHLGRHEENPPWKLTLADTGLEAMTGCRIKRIQEYVGNEPFMLTYGDGLGDVDITKLVAFHKSHGKLATITAVRPPSRFGELTVKGDSITAFEEKPQAVGGLINGGFFVCQPEVFDYLTDDESCTFEREPLQKLAQDGQLKAFKHTGFWMPMDTSREYLLLNEMWNRGEAPWVKKGLSR